MPLFPPLRAGSLLTIGVFFAVGFGTVAEARIDLSDVPLPFGGFSTSSKSSSSAPQNVSSSSSSTSSAQARRTTLKRLQRDERRFGELLRGTGAAIWRTQVVDLTNAERKKNGLRPLREDSGLDAFAQAFAKDLQVRNYFSHDTPEGLTFQQRFQSSVFMTTLKHCLACTIHFTFAENIAFGQPNAKAVVDAWIASREHHENILNPDLTKIGVGRQGRYWSQVFFGQKEE